MMGNTRTRQVAGQPSTADDTAALVQFAIDRVLHSAPDFNGLPEVLERFATAWHAEAALVLRVQADGVPVVLAAHPPQAAGDAALAAAITSALSSHPATAAIARAGGAFEARLPGHGPGGAGPGALIAWGGVGETEQRCVTALVGEPGGWSAQTRSVARMLASVVAAQLRHAGDRAYLRERESVTRALIDASPDAVVVLDADRQLVEFNPAAEALYGWRREDVLGKDMSRMLIPPRERPRFRRAMHRFADHGDRGEFSRRMRLSVLRADGGEREVEFTPLPLTVNGQVYFCGFLRDAGELERAKAELDAEEGRFRALAQRAPAGLAETGADGRCVFVNERWCALTSGLPSDHIGRPWLSVVHGDDLDRIREEWARATANGEQLHADCRLRPNGSGERWARVAVAPLPGRGHGAAPGFAVTLTQAPAAGSAGPGPPRSSGTGLPAAGLAAELGRLTSLIATAIPGIVVDDEQGFVTHLNESFRAMFAISESPQAYVGAPIARLAGRARGALADPTCFGATMRRLAAARLPASGVQLPCADGRTIECDYWPLFVAGGRSGDIWMFRDVTDRERRWQRQARQLSAVQDARRAAERDRRRLSQENARLRELSELKTQFLATVSHELRGPLTSVVSYAELVADEKGRLSPEAAGFLDVIERNAQQMTRLVGDLLLLSRIDSGVVPLELAPVSVSEVVSDAVTLARPSAQERGVELAASVQDGPPVQADRIRLAQVIENLLSNAIKFSTAGGRVLVTASWGMPQWRIDVADSGIGIPPGEVGHVFDQFFRASNSRLAGRPGSGLGLAVVKALTELHGGRVEVASEVGAGTTFSVYLPSPAAAR